MLHNASLLIDDIEDNSILRRGIPVAHNIFGIASTINSANYVYFLSLEKTIKELPNDLVSKAVLIFTEQLLELHRGQGLTLLTLTSINDFVILFGLRNGYPLEGFIPMSDRRTIPSNDSEENRRTLWFRR